jgi:CheY-like chemotaxis protein
MTAGQFARGLARRQSDQSDLRPSGDPGEPRSVMRPSPEVVDVRDDRVRVILAEDDVLLREGLASLLDRSGFDVVGQAGDGAQLLALVRDQNPKLVVTDIRMPPTHTTEGLDAARVIREELPDIGILVCPRTSMSNMRWSCWQVGAASVTCSRVGSPTWPTSLTR